MPYKARCGCRSTVSLICVDLQDQQRKDLAEVEEKIAALEVELGAARSQLKEHASEEAALKSQLSDSERKQQVNTRLVL